jgi:hypothetical protein
MLLGNNVKTAADRCMTERYRLALHLSVVEYAKEGTRPEGTQGREHEHRVQPGDTNMMRVVLLGHGAWSLTDLLVNGEARKLDVGPD